MEMSESDLVRIFTVQPQPELMLFLGSGASASSGIPTANDMIWDFKRILYCAEKNVSPENFKDLSIESKRNELETFILTKDWYNEAAPDKKYSVLFEKVYPNSIHRKQYIDNKVRDSLPSLGYKCLGELIEHKRVLNVVTTNFDELIEKALPINSKSSFYVISPESTKTRVTDIKINNTHPQIFKLHGDFRYDNLQNTTDELKKIETDLELRLNDFYKEFGLIILGYSGRDESIQKMLHSAIENRNSFKKGFYWCLLENEQPNEIILKIINKLKSDNKPAYIVRIKDFDEFMYRIVNQLELTSSVIKDIAEARYNQTRPFSIIKGKNENNKALIKLNAIKVNEFPRTMFQFKTSITNWEELELLIKGNSVYAALSRGNAYCIGDIEVINKIFEHKILDSITTFHVANKHFDDETFVLHIYYKLIDSFLTSKLGLNSFGKRNKTFYLLQDNKILSNKKHIPQLKEEHYILATKVFTHLAFYYKIKYFNDNLYLILIPTFVATTENYHVEADNSIRKIAINKSLSKKYNKTMNEYLKFWLEVLKNSNNNIEMVFRNEKNNIYAKFIFENNYSYSSGA